MKHSWTSPRRLYPLGALLTASSLLVAGNVRPAAAQQLHASPANTLVAAMSYGGGKTLDPAREFDNLGFTYAHAAYDTLVTFAHGDLTKPVPDLAMMPRITGNGTIYNFTLRSGVKFSSGNLLTAADVVFSLKRLINVQGIPSFLLANVTSVTASAPNVVRITLAHADPATLSILTTPALSILDSKTVIANGGSDAADAAKTDKAEAYLNAHSAGSGPYMLTAYSPTNSVSLTANPNYWGAAPKVKNLLLLQQEAPTDKLTVEKGDTDIGLNLSPDQLPSLKSNASLNAFSLPQPNVFFLLLNSDKAASPATANPLVQQAIRYALDYQGILTLAGAGSVQPAGIVPYGFLGALPLSAAPKQDLAKAKALLKQAGYANGFSTEINYPSDITINGEDFGLLSQKVQSDLQAVGINAKLAPAPVAVALPLYRGGKDQIGFWEWGPDYPDPADYLNFLPGQLVGLRANWKAGADPQLASLLAKAANVSDSAQRSVLYQTIQNRLNAAGPFIPLFQPAQIVALQKSVTGFHFNPQWETDFNLIGK